MRKVQNLILGDGIAGLMAGQSLSEMGKEYLTVKKKAYVGSLCASFNESYLGFGFKRVLRKEPIRIKSLDFTDEIKQKNQSDV